MQGSLCLFGLDTLLQGREDIDVVLLRSDLFEKRAGTAVRVPLPFLLVVWCEAAATLKRRACNDTSCRHVGFYGRISLHRYLLGLPDRNVDPPHKRDRTVCSPAPGLRDASS